MDHNIGVGNRYLGSTWQVRPTSDTIAICWKISWLGKDQQTLSVSSVEGDALAQIAKTGLIQQTLPSYGLPQPRIGQNTTMQSS